MASVKGSVKLLHGLRLARHNYELTRKDSAPMDRALAERGLKSGDVSRVYAQGTTTRTLFVEVVVKEGGRRGRRTLSFHLDTLEMAGDKMHWHDEEPKVPKFPGLGRGRDPRRDAGDYIS